MDLDDTPASSLSADLKSKTEERTSPESCPLEPFDLPPFDNVPPLQELGKWNAAEIVRFLSEGAPGFDGITPD